jgi:hypothetical protein
MLTAAVLSTAACASSSSSTGGVSTPGSSMSMSAPSPDPRVGLRSGWWDPAEAIWNLRKVSATPPSDKFTNPSTPGDGRLTNSDLAFSGNIAFQGNYSGWQAWDISNPVRPVVVSSYVCPGSQSDVSVYKNLLFVSHEATSGRVDCGLQGVQDTVSRDRARGIRIYDISNITTPREVGLVQTCRGSHTHTVVVDPRDQANVYIYVSGSAGVRSPNELEGCLDGDPIENPNTARFRLEVIQVPLANPGSAHIVSSPRVFNDLTAPPRHADPIDTSAAGRGGRGGRGGGGGGAGGRGGAAPAGPRPGPNQCHDITVYPEIGLAGGACGGYGLLLDIREVANPKRLTAVADSNMSFWHSATFNNDGTKILFSDEWGGGSQPRCRSTDKPEWGSDAIFTLVNNQMTFKSYFKLPAPQTRFENCVAHNGTLIPIPGRDVMVQSWYQGGLNVFDWTDPSNPKEIAYFDRGPMDSTKLVSAGFWSAYWYNGYIVGSEISRGLDIFELRPSAWISQNEIDAAKSVRMEYFNAQMQPKLVWPASFSVVRSYLDQLNRTNGLARDKASRVANDLTAAERLSGSARSAALMQVASQLDANASGASDAAKVRMMAAATRDLANATR